MELALSLFLGSLLPLSAARLLWLRKHVVDGYSTRERVQGRFTGAKVSHAILDSGREVSEPGAFAVGAIVANLVMQPLLIVAYFYL